jgi:hypothetical protein
MRPSGKFDPYMAISARHKAAGAGHQDRDLMMRRGERDSASRHFIFQLSNVPDHYTLLFSAATRVRPALNGIAQNSEVKLPCGSECRYFSHGRIYRCPSFGHNTE